MNSFISWIGGKKSLRSKILNEFPQKEKFDRYIEVFGGAGWLLFSADKHAKMEVYNDINGDLVNLFRCVKYHPDALKDELKYVLMSREQFFDALEQVKNKRMTDIQRAARFYTLIKESFGSDLRSFGVRPKDMDSARNYLSIVAERLASVVIENLGFEHVIRTYDRPDALFYLDPPYYGTEKYYADSFTLKDHIKLKETLDNIKGKFILSYNDCEYIRELYRHYKVFAVDRMHNLVAKKGGNRYRELIIKNFT